MAHLTTKPYAVLRDESQRLHAMGVDISVKATSEQTGGSFNLFGVTCPPDFATWMHIHYNEDVAVYVVEGRLTFFWGDEKNEAGPGSYFFQPRCTPHGFRVEGDAPARILCITIPAGFDRFVIEQKTPDSDSDVETGAARHKIEILGPLPE